MLNNARWCCCGESAGSAGGGGGGGGGGGPVGLFAGAARGGAVEAGLRPKEGRPVEGGDAVGFFAVADFFAISSTSFSSLTTFLEAAAAADMAVFSSASRRSLSTRGWHGLQRFASSDPRHAL